MKLSSHASLLLAVTAFACASCSKDPGDDTEPVAGNPADQGQGAGAEGGPEGTAENPTGATDNGLASRLRLPDMTKLPTDKELATNKPKQGGGGVIARPPSE